MVASNDLVRNRRVKTIASPFERRFLLPIKMPASIHVLPRTMPEIGSKTNTSPHATQNACRSGQRCFHYKAHIATGLLCNGPQ